jgi:hypothetical protein
MGRAKCPPLLTLNLIAMQIEKPIVSESINIKLVLLQEKLSLTQQLLAVRKKEILELEACLLEIDEDIEFQKLLKSKFKEFDLK